mgnify:CR=1 FL=1
MQNARISSPVTTVASSDDDLSIDPALFETMRLKQVAQLKEKQYDQETDLKMMQRSMDLLNEKMAAKNAQLAYTRKEVENLEKLTLDAILNVNKTAE